MIQNMSNRKMFVYNTSQCGQDVFVYSQFFEGKKNGTFVDIGAYDGVLFSNTYFFEKELEWTGICVEPIPDIFKKLEANRACICVQGCIAEEEGYVSFLHIEGDSTSEMLSGIRKNYDPRLWKQIDREREILQTHWKEIQVSAFDTNKLLKKHDFQKIDFLSLDVEGSEIEVLKSWDLTQYPISIISVENNYDDPYIRELLEQKDFEYITRLRHDQIYKHKDFSG